MSNHKLLTRSIDTKVSRAQLIAQFDIQRVSSLILVVGFETEHSISDCSGLGL